MESLGDRSAKLDPARRALLEQRLRGLAARDARDPRAAQLPEGRHPTSPAQQRLWFLHLLDPASPAYVIARAWRLRGRVDAPALHAALTAVALRHPTLRTRFVHVDGVPVQEIVPDADIPLVIDDLRAIHADVREMESRTRARSFAARPFDLASAPLVRACLQLLGEDDQLLVVTVHHIVGDDWSMQVLARDLSHAYAAARAGASPRLPPLPAHFTDWVARESDTRRGEGLESDLVWWRAQLEGAESLDLPLDFPRPARRSDRGAVCAFEIDRTVHRRCLGLARALGATPFGVCLAAFAALVHRWSGAADFVVGVPSALRTRTELEELIGFLVETLPIRTELSGDASFAELVARVRDAAVGAVAHQHVPFDRIVEAVHPERDASRTPLVQVSFAFQNAPRHPLRLEGLDSRRVDLDTGTSKFDLTLFLHDDGGDDGFRGEIEYATDLFTAGTARRFATHYARVLAAACEDPALRLSTLPLLDATERERLIEDAHAALLPAASGASLAALFEARVDASPRAVAVEAGTERLSYAQLDARADGLAHRLVRAGVRPGDRVGLLAERSPALVTAMVAVAKAGAVYVPIDPAFPTARIHEMLADAGVGVVVAPAHAAAAIELPSNVAVIEPVGDSAVASRARLRCEVDADAPAYVMYTSGSTGRPKGVVVPHRAVANLVVAPDYAPLGSGDVVAHLANPAFDAATWEVWGALLAGARLVIIDRETALSPGGLARALETHGVTAAFLTTALFNLVAREAPHALARLDHLLFGGETADARVVRDLLHAGAPRRLVHVYGPTETTVFATWHQIRALDANATTVPIGRAVAGASVHLLDARLEPVPPGLPGDLYIGGAGVALGYLDREALTAERFVADPFRAGSTLYRTGDRARLAGDAIEFLGRDDAQVKIRGFRIEPAEVQIALGEHPAVAEALVVVRDAGGDRQLAAYAVAAPGFAIDAAELLAHLARRLPAYMLPASVTLLGALPVTPNGKLDVRALPAPEAPRREERARAGDVLEHQLVALWEELLGVSGIGVRDDFFALGGHSLLAARMMSRIEGMFGRQLPLAALFEGATIAHIADALRRDWPDGRERPLVRLNEEGSRPPLFFLHGDVGGGGLYGLTLARHLGDDQPLFLLPPLPPAADGTGPDIREMARRQLDVVRAACPRGPYRLGGYCNGGLVGFEMARLLEAEGETVEHLMLVMASAESVYLGPVLRYGAPALRLGTQPGVERMTFEIELTEYLLRLRRRLHESGWRDVPRLARAALRAIGRWGARIVAPRPAPPALVLAPGEASRTDRMRHSRWAVRSYVPASYGSTVTLFWASEHPATPWDESTGWRRVARHVDVVSIPGTHDSCVSGHIGELAARMTERLRAD